MVMHTFQDYLGVFDNQISKRNELAPAELLEFLRLTQAKDSHKNEFSEQRRRIWFALVAKKLPDFTSSNLISLWKELSNAKIKPETYRPNFFMEWEKSLVRTLEAGELLDVLEIYIEMNTTFPVQLAQKWSQLGAKEIKSWPASSLAFVIYAFGEMRLRPEDEFVRLWIEKTPAKVSEFSPSAVADFVYGVGKLWLKEEVIINTVKSMIEHCDKNQVLKMSAHSLVKTLYGLCELKLDPMNLNAKFMEVYFDRVKSAMEKLTPKELSTAAWNLSRLNIEGDTGFTKTWSRVVLANMRSFTARDLYLSLLAAVHLKLDREFANPWMDYATSQLKHFWPQALASVLMDLHWMEARPAPGFLIEWEKATRRSFSDMYTKDLVGSLVGLAMIEKQPDQDFLDDWYKEVKRKADRFTKNSVEDLEKGFSSLKLEMRADVEEELRKAAAVHSSHEPSPDTRQKALS